MRLITLMCEMEGEMTFVVENIVHIQKPHEAALLKAVLIATADGNHRLITHLVDRIGGSKVEATYKVLCDAIEGTS